MKSLKKIIFAGILIIFLVSFASAICCEKTVSGGTCLDVGSQSSCNSAFRIDNTACESTEYCSTGTCINNVQGTCVPSSQSACDSTLGGYWQSENSKDIAECKMGCCLVGDGATPAEKIKCNVLASQRNVEPDFREGVINPLECLSMANPTKKGACVYQSTTGRICTIETKEKCTSLAREFHADMLCSAPQLGTTCTMTERTMCVEGKNEVYFQDNCNQPANVYDSSKIKDVEYWTTLKEPVESCKPTESNVDSESCGNCNYQLGSVCGKEKLGTEDATYGNLICRDLSCTYNSETKAHGSSWCSEPRSNFENAKPGQISYRLYCYNGEVQYEQCGFQNRDRLCQVDETTKLAGCVPNRWQNCIFQNNIKDCENIDKGDCKVVPTIRRDENGKEAPFLDENLQQTRAMCVPKYTPAFNFWEPEQNIQGIQSSITPNQVCGYASTMSTAGYRQQFGPWKAWEGSCFVKCVESCKDSLIKDICEDPCIKSKCGMSESFKNTEGVMQKLGDVKLEEDWISNKEGLCSAMGDCGVKADYEKGDGYSSWKELFLGEKIDKTSIPNGDSHQ